MKLRNHPFSIQPRIFDGGYKHPWYEQNKKYEDRLIRPNPPTKEAIEKAKFTDKTYRWRGDDSVRSRNKRSS